MSVQLRQTSCLINHSRTLNNRRFAYDLSEKEMNGDPEKWAESASTRNLISLTYVYYKKDVFTKIEIFRFV